MTVWSGLVVEEEPLYLLVDELEVLLDLVNFELIAAVTDGTVLLLVLVATGADWAVEEVIPVEGAVVFYKVVLKADGTLLRNAQLLAEDLS